MLRGAFVYSKRVDQRRGRQCAVTAAPNATMNDSLALGSKIDTAAAVAQAAYNALATCNAALKFYKPGDAAADASGCVAVPTSSGPTVVWNNVLASRSKGVAYTNTRTYAIDVSAGTSGSACKPNLLVKNPADTLFTLVARGRYEPAGVTGGGGKCPVYGRVPPGASYQVTGDGSLDYWAELY